MRILLTNDDGIDAPGIEALHAVLAGLDPRTPEPMGEVYPVAPLTVQSATGHGVTFHQPLMTRPVRVNGHPGMAVDGRPADCVKIGLTELWGQRFGEGTRPDLVVSGMNAGANVGINVIYSGTVAAAIEAGFLGVPAIAISLHLGRGRPDFGAAAVHARRAIETILAAGQGAGAGGIGLGAHEVLNINIPRFEEPEAAAESTEQILADREAMGMPAQPHSARAITEFVLDPAIAGPDADDPHDPDAHPPIVVCPMNVHGIADRFERRTTPAGQVYYWSASGGFDFHETDAGSDVELLFKRCITVTPLTYDLTRHDAMGAWRGRLGAGESGVKGRDEET